MERGAAIESRQQILSAPDRNTAVASERTGTARCRGSDVNSVAFRFGAAKRRNPRIDQRRDNAQGRSTQIAGARARIAGVSRSNVERSIYLSRFSAWVARSPIQRLSDRIRKECGE